MLESFPEHEANTEKGGSKDGERFLASFEYQDQALPKARPSPEPVNEPKEPRFA